MLQISRYKQYQNCSHCDLVKYNFVIDLKILPMPKPLTSQINLCKSYALLTATKAARSPHKKSQPDKTSWSLGQWSIFLKINLKQQELHNERHSVTTLGMLRNGGGEMSFLHTFRPVYMILCEQQIVILRSRTLKS